ncbi:MAG TPA: YidB family protein, partial [Pyrinomonadaceae bacterium]|nr:YidB family protein [Pyrinomonadaceae bacterium]
MFDSIINEAKGKFGLGDKAGGLVAALLGLIANPASGGFGGFIDRFKDVGLGDAAQSWIETGDNTPLSDAEVESAFGDETLASVAAQTGISREKATSALG